MKAIATTAAALLLATACGPDDFTKAPNDASNDGDTAAVDHVDPPADGDPPLDASDARTDDAKLDAPADSSEAGEAGCGMIWGATACNSIMTTFCTALFNKCGGMAPQTCVAWWASNFPTDYDCSVAKYKKNVCSDDANKCAGIEIPSYMCGKLQSSTPGQLGGACASFFAGFP